MMQNMAARGKYSPLYRYLQTMPTQSNQWTTTFHQLETILGFDLPSSARLHRPWWANQGSKGGHSQALAWEMAGWKTAQVDLDQEQLVFLRDSSDDPHPRQPHERMLP